MTSPGAAAEQGDAHGQYGAEGKSAKRRRRHSSNASRGPPAQPTSVPAASQVAVRGGSSASQF
eukprot:11160848-Lingulodinium_polyedra.AAC.1